MIEIRMDVCDECHKGSGELLFNKLKEKHGISMSILSIRGDHPLWKEYHEQREVLKVKCICFEYDDCLISLCKTHIMEYVDQL